MKKTNRVIPTTSPANPRLLAVESVVRVTRDNLPLALASEADTLDVRDRALAFEIAFGTVRYLSLLDAILASCISRPLANKRHFLRGVLTTAIYQARYMRVPDRAAVNEAVNLVKNSPEKAQSGFVNAVLRKAVKVDVGGMLAKVADQTKRLALEYAHPEWLVKSWLQNENRDLVIARLQANNIPPTLTLRTNTLLVDSAALLAALADVQAVAAAATPDAILLPDGGAVEGLAGFSQGWFAVQDQAAQWVSRFLAPQPGDRVLDACAAPGGKTAHIAALAKGEAEIVAYEKFPSRLLRLQDNLQRLKIPGVKVCQGDVTESSLLEGEMFERILVDAPCSGTGIIRRHPEIKWRRGPKDVAAMIKEQAAILTALAQRLQPGGTLLYATCSVEPAENEKQIQAFLERHPDWRRQPITTQQDGVDPILLTKDGDFRVEPGQFAMDGFYAARLHRQG